MKKLYVLLIVFISGLLLLSGCSNQMEAEAVPVSEVSEFHIIDRSENTMTAYVHGDHWHGSIPVMQPGGALTLGFYIENEAGEQLVLGAAYTLSVSLADNAPEDIVSFSPHGDHIDFSAEKEGLTVLMFTIEHEGELFYEVPPIGIIVENEPEPEVFNETISSFRLVNRADQAAGPYVHVDHWDGRLPALKTGERTSLEALIENEGKETLIVDGTSLTLGAHIPEEAAGNIVSFDFHGDHVYLIGMEPGETRVIFTLEHGGEIVYTTPPLRVTVE